MEMWVTQVSTTKTKKKNSHRVIFRQITQLDQSKPVYNAMQISCKLFKFLLSELQAIVLKGMRTRIHSLNAVLCSGTVCFSPEQLNPSLS